MKCTLCQGRGTHNRDLNCRHSNVEAFEYGCRIQLTCKRCEGVGYLGVDLARVKSFLQKSQNSPYLNADLRKEIKVLLKKKSMDIKHTINLLTVVHTHLHYQKAAAESMEARILLRKFT